MKRIPVQLFHKDPETGSVPLKDLDRSAPAVAKIKHTAGVWVEVEFQFDDCSQSIVTFPKVSNSTCQINGSTASQVKHDVLTLL